MSLRRWLPVALALLLLAVAVGSAAAQANVVASRIRLDIESFSAPLKPGVPTTVNGTLTYIWENGAIPTGSTTITLAAAPAGDAFNVTVDPTSVTITPGRLQGGSETTPFSVTITAANGTLAETRGNTTITATSTDNGNLRGSTTPASLNFLTAFLPKTVVTGPEGEVLVRGGAAQTLEFRVRNDGNADIQVGLSVTVPTDVQYTAPETIPSLKPGEETIVPVEIRTPWTGGIRGDLKLTATGTPLEVEGRGSSDAHTLTLVSTSAVPVGGATLPLAGLAVAGLLVARRRLW
ncbi:MAG TPA: hypothetical protein VNZ52_06170 [Candidatus Thermoplasmatota archaeon]|nr:hypothetical protein [Candidatus Thermoplasmatota archaeon]